MSKPKTLVIIQTVSKIGRAISDVIVAFSLIIIAICLALIIYVKNSNSDFQKIYEYIQMFRVYQNYSVYGLYYVLTSTIIFFSWLGFLSGLSSHYFRKQLETGHPFTTKLSKELMTLGILQIVVPFIGAGCDYAVKLLFEAVSHEYYFIDMKILFNISLGVFYILTSFICKYGTELLFKENNSIAVNN